MKTPMLIRNEELPFAKLSDPMVIRLLISDQELEKEEK